MYASFSPQKQEARAAELKTEIERLQLLLGPDEDAEQIVKKHIQLLHRYNEAKDATQFTMLTLVNMLLPCVKILIGRLAEIKQTTVRKIHEEYGLDTTE